MSVRLATAPARPDRPNEDFVAASPDAIVLLDGAGAPARMPSGCRHGTAWFTRTLGALILAEIQPGIPLANSVSTAIESVTVLHKDDCDLGHPGSPSATVTAVRRQDDHLDYLVLGDSVVLLDRKNGPPLAVTDDRHAITTRELRKDMDALPTGSPEHTEALRDFIEAMRAHRNKPGGFWSAGTDPKAAEQALTGTEPLTNLTAAALLSDGAARLANRFAQLTWPALLTILTKEGPTALITRTRQAESQDPEGQRWPRGKPHDDATAAHWPLTP